ncbi:MAG: TetR/AcrR family transcriptional regulator [Actinomycetota bacterium]|nr:TetR/AcrR family transcriptional regulator [Actinomycetota bacterium]
MGLSRSDWVEAGLAALCSAGLDAIAVEPLARSLGTTKGSFYWHFADRAELVAATVELWEQRETTDVIVGIAAISDPRERLAALGSGAYAHAATRTALATLLAHGDDPKVAEVLGRVTRTRMAFLAQLYADVDCDRPQLRARLAYALYLGMALLRSADPAGDPVEEDREVFLALAIELMWPGTGTTS